VTAKNEAIRLRSHKTRLGKIDLRAIKAFLLLLTTAAPLAASAQNATPNLTGRWSIEVEAIQIDRGHNGTASPLEWTLEVDVTWQEGARFSGQEIRGEDKTSAQTLTDEHFGGVIETGGRSIHMVDENGMRDCRIVSIDKLVCSYRHIESHRTIVAVETWKRVAN
jgi:hypothetical protein